MYTRDVNMCVCSLIQDFCLQGWNRITTTGGTCPWDEWIFLADRPEVVLCCNQIGQHVDCDPQGR